MGCALLLDAAASRDDLLARAGAEANALRLDGLRDLAVGQHLELLAGFDEACRGERLHRHVAADALEVRQADQLRFLAERIGEAALRHATRDRHLAAFELRLAAARAMMARARLAALVTLARRLAGARARAAAEALAVAMRTDRRREVVESDLLDGGFRC